MIQVEGGTLWSKIDEHFNSNWNEEELFDQWKESIFYQLTRIIKLDVEIYVV
jgi:hypothetical protein